MSLVKAPLLSLGASGTLASRLTYRRTNRQNVALEVPTHPDARTWSQIYHRWIYSDACFYWHTLSAAAKAAYAVLAKGLNQTGFNIFIADYFATRPDVAAHYHLDYAPGAVVKDYSANSNDGTLFGPAIVPQIFKNAFDFDGVDDRVYIPHSASLNVSEITLEAWAIPFGGHRIIAKWDPSGLVREQYFIAVAAGSTWYFRLNIDGSDTTLSTPDPPLLGVLTHVVGTFDGTTMIIYIDGDPENSLVEPGAINEFTTPVGIGAEFRLGVPISFFEGIIDEAIIYNRALSPSQVRAHSNRRSYLS